MGAFFMKGVKMALYGNYMSAWSKPKKKTYSGAYGGSGYTQYLYPGKTKTKLSGGGITGSGASTGGGCLPAYDFPQFNIA